MSETIQCGCVVPRLFALATVCGEPYDVNNPLVVKGDLSDGWALIDEIDANLSYIGFPVLNPDQADPLCAILEVKTTLTVTTRKWAGGTMEGIHLWSNRTLLDYYFLS